MGALQLTANPEFREPFSDAGLDVVRVPPNDIDQFRAVLASVAEPAGFLFEPIQGEAGVMPVHAQFVQQAAALLAERGVPLIADECQTGLGRTGRFLACSMLGVRPDYVILSKALGGGLAKVSAVLISRDRYQETFDLLHSSTFADDELSSTIALKTLQLLDEHMVERCGALGEELLQRLRRLHKRYPAAIKDVRGAGLLLGVELARPSVSSGYVLEFLANRDLLGPVVSGYLLREQRIRIAPTLSDSFTLRIQPSVNISREHVDRFHGGDGGRLRETLCGRRVGPDTVPGRIGNGCGNRSAVAWRKNRRVLPVERPRVGTGSEMDDDRARPGCGAWRGCFTSSMPTIWRIWTPHVPT